MVDLFEQELSKLNFPNFRNQNEINEAYNYFIQKIMSITDKVAPMKERRVKKNLRKHLMRKLQMKLKIVINYLKSLKNQEITH